MILLLPLYFCHCLLSLCLTERLVTITLSYFCYCFLILRFTTNSRSNNATVLFLVSAFAVFLPLHLLGGKLLITSGFSSSSSSSNIYYPKGRLPPCFVNLRCMEHLPMLILMEFKVPGFGGWSNFRYLDLFYFSGHSYTETLNSISEKRLITVEFNFGYPVFETTQQTMFGYWPPVRLFSDWQRMPNIFPASRGRKLSRTVCTNISHTNHPH